MTKISNFSVTANDSMQISASANEKGKFIFKNTLDSSLKVFYNKRKQPLFLFKHKGEKSIFNIYEMLAVASKYSKNTDELFEFVRAIDRYASGNPLYWKLRSDILMSATILEDTRTRIKSLEEQQTYLMKDHTTGLIKIGKSNNPRKREKTLQSEKPQITLFASHDKNIEKELHAKYKNKRIRGEWFNLSDKDLKDIVKTYGFKKIAY